MGISDVKTAGACQVVTRDLRRQPLRQQVSIYDNRRSQNAYYPDFAFRVDMKRKCLQVLSVVGPSKFVQGKQIESASCFNQLQKEGDAVCIEEYGKRLGYVYSTSSSMFFPAIFECKVGEVVKWVNPLPFDAGAEDLVMSLARHASEWISFFQRNISMLRPTDSDHTRLSLVLQLDVINCETWKHASKMPMDIRFGLDGYAQRETQGAAKKQKGVRYRVDRKKWVAEFNPPGKKNNKISLGEYDNPFDAARAADAGMYCYGSKRGASYNFDDSPSYLQRIPHPHSDDKDAVRNWAREFAKLTSKTPVSSSASIEPAPLTFTSSPSHSGSSWSDGPGNPATSSQCLTFGNAGVSTAMLQHTNSTLSVSNIPPPTAFQRANYALEYQVHPTPNPPMYESDSGSAMSFSLEDVADMYTDGRDIPTMTLEDYEQDGVINSAQINSSPPPSPPSQECMFGPSDDTFSLDPSYFFNPASPQCNGLMRTVPDSRAALDDVFQTLLSSFCPGPSPSDVERCSIQLIR